MSWLQETHGTKFELVRHFLRRMFDSELCSAPGQWAAVAVSAFALLLPAGILLVREGSLNPEVAGKYRILSRLASPEPYRAAALADELALLTLVMAVTGLIALLAWQSLFPSTRDCLALAGMPIRTRQIFAARFASMLLFSTALVAALNLLPSLLAPMEFAGRWQKNPSYLVNFAAQAAASGAGCFFLLFALVALQGVLLNVLPARWFARVSVWVQAALIGVLFLAALGTGFIKDWTQDTISRLPEFGAWAPPVWFAALHERILGDRDPLFAAMAMRGLLALGTAAALAVLAYLVSYRRYRRLLLERPVEVSAPRKRQWSLLRLLARTPREEAVIEFMAKTLARSRLHKLAWLAYAGAAIGIMLNSSLIAGVTLKWSAGWRAQLQFLFLFWPLGISAILLPGFRHVLSLPVELPANWIFRITESEGRAEWMRAVERFVILYAIVPIYAALLPVGIAVLGWELALRAAALQVLVSLAMLEVLFYSWQQLPFTCSYRPGKRPLAGIVASYIAVLGVLVPVLARIIGAVSQFTQLFLIFFAVFGAVWLWFRKMRREGWGEARILYEDLPQVVADLGIRDLTRWSASAPVPVAPLVTREERAENRGTFRLSPGFRRSRMPAVAVISLALGIGANSAMFSVADFLVLRPLPVPRASEIVEVRSQLRGQRSEGLSYPEYLDFREKSRSFRGLAASQLLPLSVAEKPAFGMLVTTDFFQAMEVAPLVGRAFRPEERREAVAVLSYTFWKNEYGARADVIGGVVSVNGVPYTIVGVAPEKFAEADGPFRPALYVPLLRWPHEQRADRVLTVRGRLRPGVSIAQADAEARVIGAQFERNRTATVRTPFQVGMEQFPGNALVSALAVALTGIVLLIACANVTSLLLSRGRARSREIAVRLALGASRARLVRQLLRESLVLAIAGGALGLLVARVCIEGFTRIRVQSELPFVFDVKLNARVVVYALFVSLASAVLCGLAPALQATRTDLLTALKSGSGEDRHGRFRGRNALVAMQVAGSLWLLLCAAQILRGTTLLLSAPPGFRTDHILLANFNPTARAQEFYRHLRERARAMPGVKAAAPARSVPFGILQGTERVMPEGFQEPVTVWTNVVGEDYFDILRVPVLQGRAFRETDKAGAPRVAIVNEQFARRYYANQSPVGRRLRLGGGGPPVEIVGVARQSKYVMLNERPREYLYLPLAQNPQAKLSLLVETWGDPGALAGPLRETVRAIDASLPVTWVVTMPEHFQRATSALRLSIWIFGAMGLLGLALGMAGLYGLMAYWVSRRTREIGIRMALGADAGKVRRMVLRQALRLAGAGVAIGLLLSPMLSRALAAATYIPSLDPRTLVVIPAGLLALAALGAWAPARRASRVDPVEVLRQE